MVRAQSSYLLYLPKKSVQFLLCGRIVKPPLRSQLEVSDKSEVSFKSRSPWLAAVLWLLQSLLKIVGSVIAFTMAMQAGTGPGGLGQ